MKITVSMRDPKDVETLQEILKNLPEHSSDSLKCHGWDYDKMEFDFTEDLEEQDAKGNWKSKEHRLTLRKAMMGWQLFLNAEISGATRFAMDGGYTDPGAYDCNTIDAISQYALLGKLIYG